MKIFISLFFLLCLCSCATNPHEAKELDLQLDKQQNLTDEQSIGVKDGNMVFQNKVNMAEELRRLQIEVYSLEDRVFGSRKYGSKGLYGALKKCRTEVVSKENGGDGKLMWTESLQRVTSEEKDFDIGYDDKDKLIGVSQEFLKDRIQRFKNYKSLLEKREDEYQDKVDICQARLKSQKSE